MTLGLVLFLCLDFELGLFEDQLISLNIEFVADLLIVRGTFPRTIFDILLL